MEAYDAVERDELDRAGAAVVRVATQTQTRSHRWTGKRENPEERKGERKNRADQSGSKLEHGCDTDGRKQGVNGHDLT